MQFRVSEGEVDANSPFGSFDPRDLHQSLRDRDYSEYVNPLMTSMKCLDKDLLGSNTSVQGRDLLDPDPERNPDFSGHNHVLIPYCSSDLWLAEEVRDDQRECSCSNLTCFGYKPDSARLQFAFRGKLIFQTIFRQLLNQNGMGDASELLLGGSSAGGVGVINLAQWVRQEMSVGTDLLLLADSAWFVDFQGGIFRVFDGAISENRTLSEDEISDNQRLFGILSNHTACNDTSLGFPCCISAHCVMTTRNDAGTGGGLAYFPEFDQRTFMLSSVYDVFLLAPAITGLDDFNAVAAGENENIVSLLIDFLRVVGEYGGEMNFTLSQTYDTVRG